MIITKLIDAEKYVMVSVLNNEGQIIDSYDICSDEDSIYRYQKLYVDDGKIEEIGDVITCTKYELERNLLSLAWQGRLDVDVVR